MIKKAKDYDIIFISYDEPNAEENWKHLNTLVDGAKRVHGVKGIDAAHKEAAKLSSTNHFFVIDGDTQIEDWFFNQALEDINPNYVYSWSAKNSINDLVYGNGGAKLWPKHVMEKIQSHELNGETDFCWIAPYYQMDATSSITIINTTPFQAFRAGFREGVTMSTERGVPVANPKTDVWPGNYQRLLAWMNIGKDIKNGFWAITGATTGCYEVCSERLDITLVTDYDWLEEMWETRWKDSGNGVLEECDII